MGRIFLDPQYAIRYSNTSVERDINLYVCMCALGQLVVCRRKMEYHRADNRRFEIFD